MAGKKGTVKYHAPQGKTLVGSRVVNVGDSVVVTYDPYKKGTLGKVFQVVKIQKLGDSSVRLYVDEDTYFFANHCEKVQ